MLTILESKVRIADAQERFSRSLDKHGPEIVPTSIGYQSGHFDTDVLWIPALDIWTHFGRPPEGKSSRSRRYWNVFGIGKPTRMVSIVGEINPPVEGIDRKIAGAFASDPSGNIVVVHRGRFNIGGGMTKQFFRQRFSRPYQTVADGPRHAHVIVVGAIEEIDFGQRLREFIFEVNRIKSIARGGNRG